MASIGVSSRRKQSKPQRLPDGEDAPMDSSDGVVDYSSDEHSDQQDASPIDLSTKSEDRLFSLSQLPNPQQLLSLCAQLAEKGRPMPLPFAGFLPGLGLPLLPQQSPSPAVLSASSGPTPSEEKRHHCAGEGCSQSFPSRGGLLWHCSDAHPSEKLLECARCGERVCDRDQLRDHPCLLPARPSSADPRRATSPDADRGSVPADASTPFRVVSRTASPAHVSAAPTNLLAALFPKQASATAQLGAPQPLSLAELERGERGGELARGKPHDFLPPFHHPFPPHMMMREFVPPQHRDGEDDWEALMEISTTDESEKIRALVGDKALPTTDPNQCILCRRVLSCKSALQMHYRTHTGERPFKCKICQRAFTTKGNLKTHMGVHRAKHSFRGPPMGLPLPPAPIHVTQQCPICQKRCAGPQQLQMHIAEHTQQLTQRPPPPGMGGRMPPGFAGFPMFPFPMPGMPPVSFHSDHPFSLASMLRPDQPRAQQPPPPMTDLATLSEKLGLKMEDFGRPPASLPDLLGTPKREVEKSLTPSATPLSLATALRPSESSPGGSSDTSNDHVHDQTDGSSVGRTESDAEKASESAESAEKERPQRSEIIRDPADMDQLFPSMSEKRSENPLDAMQKMWAETEPPAPRPPPQLSKHQCGVCFKHFSSSSALQIHMRTHTGDKPFKCEVCARAFTTRGNLKVHMGTHMWQQSPSRRGRRIFDSSPDESRSSPSLPAMPPLPFPPGLFPPTAAPPLDMMMMLMRTVCSVCQKVCASPSELEEHLKGHLSGAIPAEKAAVSE